MTHGTKNGAAPTKKELSHRLPSPLAPLLPRPPQPSWLTWQRMSSVISGSIGTAFDSSLHQAGSQRA